MFKVYSSTFSKIYSANVGHTFGQVPIPTLWTACGPPGQLVTSQIHGVFKRFPQAPEEILPDLGAEAARLPSGSLKLWLEDVGIIDSLR